MLVASQYLTAAVLTCQLQCLDNPSWREDSSFISSCSSHRFGGRWLWPCSAIHPGASQTPFLADYREKLGFPELCRVLELSLGCSTAAFQQLEGREVFCTTAPSQWHFPQGDRGRRNCGTELSIQPKNHPWRLGTRAMDQSWSNI